MRLKILILLIIICGGTYMLTHSVSIAAGVAVLLYVMDRLLKAWADKKDRQYFYGGTDGNNTDGNNGGTDNNEDNEPEKPATDGQAD